MSSFGWFVCIIVLIGFASCCRGLLKETDRRTAQACYEQTKNEKCWDIVK